MDDERQQFAKMEAEERRTVAEQAQIKRLLETAPLSTDQRDELLRTAGQNEEFLAKMVRIRLMLALEEARYAARSRMLTGFGIALLGALFTTGSYPVAGHDGTYVVAWGALLFGLWRGITGAVRMRAICLPEPVQDAIPAPGSHVVFPGRRGDDAEP